MGLYSWLSERLDNAKAGSQEIPIETVIGEIQERLSTKALAFYIATSYIADTISKCEFKRFVNGEEIHDRFYYLFNISPNVNQNAFDLKNKLIFKLFDTGEALIFENNGNLYVADSFNKEYHPLKGDKFVNITLDNEVKTFDKKASDVFYFRLDEGKLKSLLSGILDDYTEVLNYAFDIYKSSNSEKYKLILDEIRAGDVQFQQDFEKVIKKQLEAFINNPKSVYPQFKGQKLEKITSGDGKTDSTDIRNIRKEIFETTAEAFKMPVSMLYGNMTNVKDIVSSYITFRIDPLAKMISEELTRKTGTEIDYEKGTYFKVDTTRIMHIDIFEIADKMDKLLSDGVYDIDEIRIKVGDSPLNTDFSQQHWMTKNNSKIEDVLAGEGLEGGE